MELGSTPCESSLNVLTWRGSMQYSGWLHIGEVWHHFLCQEPL